MKKVEKMHNEKYAPMECICGNKFHMYLGKELVTDSRVIVTTCSKCNKEKK